MDVNFTIIVLTLIMNALAFTVGLAYNEMVQSVIRHYTPKDKPRHGMQYNIYYAIIITCVFVGVILMFNRFFPEVSKSVILK